MFVIDIQHPCWVATGSESCVNNELKSVKKNLKKIQSMDCGGGLFYDTRVQKIQSVGCLLSVNN